MIEQVMSLKNRYDKMVKGFKEEDFKGWFTEYFALYPFVTRIQWTQYTPHFNDGEACEFGVNDPELQVAQSYLDRHPDVIAGQPDWNLHLTDTPDDEEEEECERYVSTYILDKAKKAQYPELYDAVEAIKILFEAEDILQHVFGDHASVIATPDMIECEEYEHD